MAIIIRGHTHEDDVAEPGFVKIVKGLQTLHTFVTGYGTPSYTMTIIPRGCTYVLRGTARIEILLYRPRKTREETQAVIKKDKEDRRAAVVSGLEKSIETRAMAIEGSNVPKVRDFAYE